MKLAISSALVYKVLSPSSLVLNIHALRTQKQTALEESLVIEPYVKVEELSSDFGENRLIRMEIVKEQEISISYKAIVDNFYKETDHTDDVNLFVSQLDRSVIPYLYPSRY